MSYEALFGLSGGNNDDSQDQTGEVIINIDTADADANGLPMDTSDAPEADVAVAQETVAEADADADAGNEAADTAQDMGELSEALNEYYERGDSLSAKEINLIRKLAYAANRRAFPGATRSQIEKAALGAGLNDAAGNAAWVEAGLNENEKGIMANIKKFIERIKDFFKGIAASIGTWISGSKKFKGRAEELKKRASSNEGGKYAATGSGEFAKVNMADQASKLYINAGTFSVKAVLDGAEGLTKLNGELLGKASAMSVCTALGIALNGLNPKAGEADFKGIATKTATELNKAFPGAGGNSAKEAKTYIGGLQVGTLVNAEEYSFRAFAKVNGGQSAESWPTVSLADIGTVADKAIALLDTVIAYQGGWKEREKAKEATIKALEATTKGATDGYKSANESKGKEGDGMFKSFMQRRKLSNAAGQTLFSVQQTENKVLSHSISVASALITYGERSLAALSGVKKGADKAAKGAKKDDDKKDDKAGA